MLNGLSKRILFGVLVALSLIKGVPALSAAASHESERFEVFHDPENPSIVRAPITRRLPTKEEMDAAREDYRIGELNLLGRPFTTLWGTIEEVNINIPEGLRRLRHAAYSGHPKACSLLVGCFRHGRPGIPKNEIFAKAFSASSKKAQDLWEASQRYLAEGKEIPTIDISSHDVWGPIERARQEMAKKTGGSATAAPAGNIELHAESKEPEEEDPKESTPLLDGLRQRHTSS